VLDLRYNENPYSIPNEVKIKIINSLDKLHKYPMRIKDIYQQLSEYYNVSINNLLLVQGIDECVDRIIYFYRNNRFVATWPGFDGFWQRINVHQVPFFNLGINHDFSVSKDGLNKLRGNDFALLANPNNPTGQLLSRDEIEKIAKTCNGFLIDETYIDYSQHDSILEFRYKNAFCFRSFSKAFGLAGLRLGVLIGCAEVIQRMKYSQWYCNINAISISALSAILNIDHVVKANAEKVIIERKRMERELGKMNFEIVSTKTNFILIKISEIDLILTFLKNRNILVKYADVFGLPNYLRISISTYKNNERFLKAMKIFSQRIAE